MGPQEYHGDPTLASGLADRYNTGVITQIRPDVDRVSFDLPGGPAEVWDALNQVYEGIGIEVAHRDSQALSLSNPDFRVSRRLGGERLSTYLNCGRGLTGPFADRFRISMNILSRVVSSTSGATSLETTIEARASNPDGTSSNRTVGCGSTHLLEARIAREVAEIIGG
jgi:hypothetical protein